MRSVEREGVGHKLNQWHQLGVRVANTLDLAYTHCAYTASVPFPFYQYQDSDSDDVIACVRELQQHWQAVVSERDRLRVEKETLAQEFTKSVRECDRQVSVRARMSMSHAACITPEEIMNLL